MRFGWIEGAGIGWVDSGVDRFGGLRREVFEGYRGRRLGAGFVLGRLKGEGGGRVREGSAVERGSGEGSGGAVRSG